MKFGQFYEIEPSGVEDPFARLRLDGVEIERSTAFDQSHELFATNASRLKSMIMIINDMETVSSSIG